LDGEKLSQLKKANIPQLRRKIGVVFQDYKLIKEMNVWENIALPFLSR
jgi:cell division transport system ATP-binding protein